jgi:hypothetical protein
MQGLIVEEGHPGMGIGRRKIRLIECNAQLTFFKGLCGRCLSFGGPLPSYDPIPPPPLTLYCIRLFSILIHTGGGEL